MNGVPDISLEPTGPYADEPVPVYPDLHHYHLIEKMGDGAFSNVYKAFDKVARRLVAVKVVRKHELNAKQRANVLKEVTIMKNLYHSNIVSLISFAESKDFYFLVLELLPGGELFHQIVKLTYFSEDLARHVILQVAEGIRYLHEERGVVHRDIKPENLLFEPIPMVYADGKPPPVPDRDIDAGDDEEEEKVDEGLFIPGVGGGGIGKIKIADFGLSKVVWDEQTMTPCGTVGYTAPEIVKDERYSKSVDMWALGCVLYTLLCGFPPFYDDCIRALTEKVAKGYYTFLSPWWDEISDSAKDLISHLLTVDPEERYSIEEFLRHPWCGRHKRPPPIPLPEAPPVVPEIKVDPPPVAQGVGRAVPSYSSRPRSSTTLSTRISPPPLLIPPNGFGILSSSLVFHPHISGATSPITPEFACKTSPDTSTSPLPTLPAGWENQRPVHASGTAIPSQISGISRRTRAPLTPMTPGGVSMKEIFDVSYAVQRMEEEGAARRRHRAAMQTLNGPKPPSGLSNGYTACRGGSAKRTTAGIAAGTPRTLYPHQNRHEFSMSHLNNDDDGDDDLSAVSRAIQNSKLGHAQQDENSAIAVPVLGSPLVLKKCSSPLCSVSPGEVQLGTDALRNDHSSSQVEETNGTEDSRNPGESPRHGSGFALCLDNATLLGRRKKGGTPSSSPADSPKSGSSAPGSARSLLWR